MIARRAIEFSVMTLAVLAAIGLESGYANARNYNAWERELQRGHINRMELQMHKHRRRHQQQEMHENQRRVQEIFNRSMDEMLARKRMRRAY